MNIIKRSPLDSILNGENDLGAMNLSGNDMRPFAHVDLALCYPLHETLFLEAESFEEKRTVAWNYLRSMCAILNVDPMNRASYHLRWVSPVERTAILAQLGPPPPYCYPLYFISVYDGRGEDLVYIGKMSSATPRFRNGHPAITKLHAPEYAGKTKRLYLCSVLFRAIDHTSAPIEFFHPTGHADSILVSLEAQLIHFFKPELNRLNTVTANVELPLSLMFENSSGTGFFEGAMFHHPRLPFPA